MNTAKNRLFGLLVRELEPANDDFDFLLTTALFEMSEREEKCTELLERDVIEGAVTIAELRKNEEILKQDLEETKKDLEQMNDHIFNQDEKIANLKKTIFRQAAERRSEKGKEKIIADLRIENETAKEWQRICEIELADLRKENTGLKRQVKK